MALNSGMQPLCSHLLQQTYPIKNTLQCFHGRNGAAILFCKSREAKPQWLQDSKHFFFSLGGDRARSRDCVSGFIYQNCVCVWCMCVWCMCACVCMWCMCACVCVVHVCICVYMCSECTHVCMEASNNSLPYFLRQVLSLYLRLTNSTRMSGTTFQRPSCSHVPSAGIVSSHHVWLST